MFPTYAQARLQGYVGSVTEVGKVLKIRLANSEYWTTKDGERKERTYWNTVTVFENLPNFAWVKGNIKKGDMILVDATLMESSFDRDGTQVYETTLAAEGIARVLEKGGN